MTDYLSCEKKLFLCKAGVVNLWFINPNFQNPHIDTIFQICNWKELESLIHRVHRREIKSRLQNLMITYRAILKAGPRTPEMVLCLCNRKDPL